ncbi:MAG: DUF5723 family protein [Bacteroidota bacterium]
MIWIILGLTGAPLLRAQQSNTLYLMHDVPQSNLLNPAIQIACKYYIGIPVLASAHLSYSNTAFTYNDLAGSDSWNLEGVVDQMHRTDLYYAEAMLVPVALGYRHRTLYFTFNIAERVQGYQTVPKEVAEMAVHGNFPFAGETARFNGLRPGGYHTREYSLGLSKVLGPYLTAGIRGKLLFGKANLTSGRSRVGLTTSGDDFSLFLDGDYTLNSSFPMTINEDADGEISGIQLDEIDPRRYLLNRGNLGAAFDLGFTYSYDDQITLSASLLDLGFVRWKTDVNNLHGEGTFEYTGTDITGDLVSEEAFRSLADSILNAMEITTSTNPYSYMMPAQLFLGGSYQFSGKIAFGAVSRSVIFRSKLHSSLTLSAQANLAERFLGTVSWSYLNNSIKNVGIGIAYHGKGVQFHAVTDNLPGFFYPFDTRTLNLRAGVNLMLGCPRNKREKERMESDGYLPKTGVCPYSEDPEKIRKRRMKAVRRLNR